MTSWTPAEDAALLAVLAPGGQRSLKAVVTEHVDTLPDPRHTLEPHLARVVKLRHQGVVTVVPRRPAKRPRPELNFKSVQAHRTVEPYVDRQHVASVELPIATVPFFERQLTKARLMAGR